MKERNLVALQSPSPSPSGAANAELKIHLVVCLGWFPVKIIA